LGFGSSRLRGLTQPDVALFRISPRQFKSTPCYPTASKPLKVIIDEQYQYAIMVWLIRHDSSVPCEPCSPARRSFQLPQNLCARPELFTAIRSRPTILDFRSLFSSGCALFHFPYPVSPVLATLAKTAGVYTNNSHSGTLHSSPFTRHWTQVLSFRTLPNSFALRKIASLFFSCNSELFHKNTRGGGRGLPSAL